MQKNKIVFLIRAYNEATRIISVIEDILSRGFDQILVVDDGSLDDTKELLHRYFGEKIIYIHHLINRGGGAALETGFVYIRRYAHDHDWEFIVTFDADGQHDITDMDSFLEMFASHPKTQVVYGSRFIVKTRSNVPLLRKIILW